MAIKRQKHESKFKARVALKATRGDKTIAELSRHYGLHPNQISQWKSELLRRLHEVFETEPSRGKADDEALIEELYSQIGKLKVENDFLKKNLGSSNAEKRKLIEPGHELSIKRQCELLGLSRSTFYYESAGESELNLRIMRAIDTLHLKYPFLGSRQMTAMLSRKGFSVNRKRVRRLMRLMGIKAIYSEPRTTLTHPKHKKFPYLLRELTIERPDQIWCTDITYIPMRHGFLYLVAVMDWMDESLCVDLELIEHTGQRFLH